MKKFALTAAAVAGIVSAGLAGAPAYAAPSQYVVVVAEGLSPQVLTLGKNYLRKADEDAELTTAFDSLSESGKSTAPAALADLSGLLETASKNGYKTGLVTTGRATAVAPLFYNLGTDAAAGLVAPTTKLNFVAGGGRAAFTTPVVQKFKAAGNTYLPDQDSLETEVKGRALVLQAAGDLSYALDRSPEEEAGLTDLTSLALDTLSANDSPFVLVVHDNLIKKAIETKDSPALFEQFRELNAVFSELNSRQGDNPKLAVAALWTGSATTPVFEGATEAQIGNSYFTLSNLRKSYAGAGAYLKKADAAKIAEFADAENGYYKGWKVSPADAAKITAGTLDGEKAVRASYEPYLKLAFNGPAGTPGAVVAGLEAPQGLAAALRAAVSVAPGK